MITTNEKCPKCGMHMVTVENDGGRHCRHLNCDYVEIPMPHECLPLCATPPPASAPGTPVERWLTHDEIFDIAYPTLAEVKVRRIIERLCALLDTHLKAYCPPGACDSHQLLAREVERLRRDYAKLREVEQEQRTRAEKAELALTEGRHLRDQSAQRVMERMQAKLDQQEAELAAAREALERISNDQPNGPTIARETLGKLKGTPMKTEHTKEPITTVDNEWKAKAERLESILTCTEKPLPPGCARTRYALEEKLVKATDLLKLAVDRLEQAYVASEQHLGATPARSWEVAANGVRKFREGIASLDARAALAANKED